MADPITIASLHASIRRATADANRYERKHNDRRAADMRRMAAWDADLLRRLEDDERAVADMAAMDAGAGDLSSRSVWA
jgi:hypothetical protein